MAFLVLIIIFMLSLYEISSKKGASKAPSAQTKNHIAGEEDTDSTIPLSSTKAHQSTRDGRSKSKATKKKPSKSKRAPTSGGNPLGAVGTSLSSLGNSALKATRLSFKSAVDLLAGKHVSLREIVGKWRLSQEIVIRKGVSINCPSTFELLKNGTVLTFYEDKVYATEYIFKERKWPRYCTIEFQARMYKGPGDKLPVMMFYKGYFKRSILNTKVILMRGRVYRISGKML